MVLNDNCSWGVPLDLGGEHSGEDGPREGVALVAMGLAILPLAALVLLAGSFRVLGDQPLTNIVCVLLVFGLAFGAGSMGISRLVFSVIPYVVIGAVAWVLAGNILAAAWVILGKLAAMIGLIILVFMVVGIFHALLAEAGRRVREVIEGHGVLTVVDSLVAILLVALGVVMLDPVMSRFPVDYADGVKIIVLCMMDLVG